MWTNLRYKNLITFDLSRKNDGREKELPVLRSLALKSQPYRLSTFRKLGDQVK